jgi:hypothetical protein
MRGLIRRAVVAAGAAVVLLGPAAGMASASGGPVLGWSPTTSAGTFDYGTVNAGSTTSQAFTVINSGGSASSALKITLTGSAAFSKTADTCTGTSLGRGKTCRVTVAYAPTTSGRTDTATLTASSKKLAVSASLTLEGASAKASPAISTSPSAGGLVGSTRVTDTATLSGGSSPSGSITFNLYGPSATAGCSGTPVDTENAAVNGDGSYTTPTGAKPTQAGTYWWTASYGGDSANNPAASGCGDESVTIATCLVMDTNSNHSFPALQDAVDAAAAGDTLIVEGTCTGTTTIGKGLTLTGQQPGGSAAPTLNGGGQGSVVTFDNGVTVTINTLTITGGSGGHKYSGGGSTFGGGILVFNATVTLNDTSITGNTATEGGGIDNGGTVTLNGTSSITGNTATLGGGISNENGSVMTLNGTSITGNSADLGGGIFNDQGSVTLNGASSITVNTAIEGGGGIYEQGGPVTLNDTSSVTGNTPDNCEPPGSVAGCTG